MLAIVSLVAGCQQTSASLRDEAESLLQVPESTQLATGGYDARQTVEGHLAALVWRQYGTDELGTTSSPTSTPSLENGDGNKVAARAVYARPTSGR
jgi:hypothetical protein